ncbi:Glutamate receptor [Ooceraea biroi]|uniref:Glutamate receptor n=1 Tax=Ooceraea biroi TaxID=2015173 RepID=A0A026WHJ8_OOCBI|nr:Glutamate receptor [Ooceraea biroi]
MRNHNQNVTTRKFELQAFVDVINTADAYKLSRLSEYMSVYRSLHRLGIVIRSKARRALRATFFPGNRSYSHVDDVLGKETES